MSQKKRSAILILTFILIIITGTVLFIIFKPSVWSDEIVAYINDRILIENGWVLSAGEFHGPFTSNVIIDDIRLRKTDGSFTVYSEKTILNLGFLQLLSGHWSMSTLQMNNAVISLKLQDSDVSGSPELTFIQDLVNKGFNIDELLLNNVSVFIENNEKRNLYSLDLFSSLHTSNGIITLMPKYIKLFDLKEKREYLVNKGEFDITPNSISGKNIEGTIDDLYFSGNLTGSLLPELKLNGDLRLNNISYKRYVNVDLSKILNTDIIDLDVEFDSDFIYSKFRGSVKDGQNKSQIAQFLINIYNEDNNYFLSNSFIDLGYCTFEGKGSLLYNKQLSLNLNFERFDMNQVGISFLSELKGVINIDGEIDGVDVKSLTADIDISNKDNETDPIISVKGNLFYNGKTLEITDSVIVEIGEGKFIVSGKSDLEKEWINITLRTEDSEINDAQWITGIDSLNGKIKGVVEFNGYWNDPSISGYITLENGNIYNMSIASMSSSFRVDAPFSNRAGSIRLIMENGQVSNYLIKEGVVDIFLHGDTLHIANARMESDDDYFQLSGKLYGDDYFVVDQFQLYLKEQRIANLDKFNIIREKDLVLIGPANFQVNEGTVEGSVTIADGDIKDVDINASNLELSSLRTVLNIDYPIEGRMFGKLSLDNNYGILHGDGEIVLKSGYWKNIEFDDFQLTANLKNDILYFEEVSMHGSNQSSFQFNGYVTVINDDTHAGIPIAPEGNVSITSEFRNFELNRLSDYYPETWSLEGKANGSLAISGSGGNPEMVFEFVVMEPRFDKITGKKILGRGRYIENRLYFEGLSGESNSGQYTGEGYLPFNLTLAEFSGERFLVNDPVSFSLEARTNHLDFLTPYISAVDSITGDIYIKLDITGTPGNPIRNGNFVVKHGTVYAFLLENPVNDLNGEAVIVNNKFIINELLGSCYLPADYNWAEWIKSNIAEASKGLLFGEKTKDNKSNFKITGSMDMSKFFKPNLAFLLSGNNVYIRTLLGEIEGVVDLDLSMTGQDTIRIAGDIVPHEAVLRMEFEEKGEYENVGESGRVTTQYKLHFPIAGNLYIKNSQVDAKLEGDMSLSKLDDGQYRFAGELNILQGKFYYYSDVFDIQEGYMLFDPSEFNPKIDIIASTEISGINIVLNLRGDLKEPIVDITDSEDFYSRDDLLQLLTIQKRFEEQDMTSEGLRDQSLNVFGAIIENEFEKNIGRASGFDLFEIEGSSSLLNANNNDFSVKLGKRVSSNLYLSYKRSFSLDQIGMEYRINRNFSLVGSYDNEGQIYIKYRYKYQY